MLEELVHDMRTYEPSTARDHDPHGAHHGDRTTICSRIAHTTCNESHRLRATAERSVAPTATSSHGMNGNQMRSTSALDSPDTSATTIASRAAPVTIQTARSRSRVTATQTAGPTATASAARLATTKYQ